MKYAILSIAVAFAISGAFIGGIFVGRETVKTVEKTSAESDSYQGYSVYEPVQYESSYSAD